MSKKIINQLTISGKSAISEKIWLKSLKLFYKSFAKNHKKAINQALINITPLIKIKQLKKKKKRLELKEFPYIINNKSRVSLALKFFLNKTKNKNEINMHQKLVNELITVADKSSVSINKRKNLYEYAFIKKKYFYYRWF